MGSGAAVTVPEPPGGEDRGMTPAAATKPPLPGESRGAERGGLPPRSSSPVAVASADSFSTSNAAAQRIGAKPAARSGGSGGSGCAPLRDASKPLAATDGSSTAPTAPCGALAVLHDRSHSILRARR